MTNTYYRDALSAGLPLFPLLTVSADNGEHTLYGEFPHPPQVPTFTWTEMYPRGQSHPWLKMWHRLNGYMGEAKPGFSNWMDGFALRYYGYGSNKLWDHSEWLGDDTLHHTERLDVHERYKRGVMRVRIPARRYAGLHAYELQNLRYLETPKTADWSRDVFHGQLLFRPRSELRVEGQTVHIPKDIYEAGETVVLSYESFKLHYSPTLRPSERRAKYSSTADGNGKPRRSKA